MISLNESTVNSRLQILYNWLVIGGLMISSTRLGFPNVSHKTLGFVKIITTRKITLNGLQLPLWGRGLGAPK